MNGRDRAIKGYGREGRKDTGWTRDGYGRDMEEGGGEMGNERNGKAMGGKGNGIEVEM